jgi:hypothetical protein
MRAIERRRKAGLVLETYREQWRKKSREFLIVDMVAHHFKHIESNIEKAPTPPEHIPLSFLVFGRTGLGTVNEGGEQMELRNLFFVVRDAVKFVHQEAGAIHKSFPVERT